MPSKGGIRMGRSGSSGGRSLGGVPRSFRAGVRQTGNGRFSVLGTNVTFGTRREATVFAEQRNRAARERARERRNANARRGQPASGGFSVGGG